MKRTMEQTVPGPERRVERVWSHQHLRIVIRVVSHYAKPVRHFRFDGGNRSIGSRLIRVEECPCAEWTRRSRRQIFAKAHDVVKSIMEISIRNLQPVGRQHLLDPRIHRRAALRPQIWIARKARPLLEGLNERWLLDSEPIR